MELRTRRKEDEEKGGVERKKEEEEEEEEGGIEGCGIRSTKWALLCVRNRLTRRKRRK